MSKIERWVAVICFLVGMALIPLLADQQFSGGQAVTISNATLAVTQSGFWSHRTQDGSGNPITSTGGALDMNMKSGSIANTAFGLNAGSAKIGITYPYTGCGITQFESGSPAGVAAMPTSSTAIAAATTCLLEFSVRNTSGGSVTITLTDNAGTPIPDLNAVTMLAGETRDWTWPNGKKFNAGVKVVASAVGVTYYALGMQ